MENGILNRVNRKVISGNRKQGGVNKDSFNFWREFRKFLSKIEALNFFNQRFKHSNLLGKKDSKEIKGKGSSRKIKNGANTLGDSFIEPEREVNSRFSVIGSNQ